MSATSDNMTAAENGTNAEGPPKTAKQLEKEAKKLEKMKKFQQKLDKQSTVSAAPKKEKVEVGFH